MPEVNPGDRVEVTENVAGHIERHEGEVIEVDRENDLVFVRLDDDPTPEWFALEDVDAIEDPAQFNLEPTIAEVRASIDEAIEAIWREMTFLGDHPPQGHPGYGIMEGLKRARLMTGEAWEPREEKDDG